MRALRELTVDQQVGLLFVTVFLLLALGTIAVLVMLRGEGEASDRRLRVLRDVRAA